MTLEQSIGRTIQEIRQQRGWSRAELSRRVGCAADTISTLEDRPSEYLRWDILRDTVTALRLNLSAVIELAERLKPQYELHDASMRVMREFVKEIAA